MSFHFRAITPHNTSSHNTWYEPIIIKRSKTTITNYKRIKPDRRNRVKFKDLYRINYGLENLTIQDFDGTIQELDDQGEYCDTLTKEFSCLILNDKPKKKRPRLMETPELYLKTIEQIRAQSLSKTCFTPPLNNVPNISRALQKGKSRSYHFPDSVLSRPRVSDSGYDEPSCLLNVPASHKRIQRILLVVVNKCFKHVSIDCEAQQLIVVFKSLFTKLVNLFRLLNSSGTELLWKKPLSASFLSNVYYFKVLQLINEALESFDEFVPGVTELLILSFFIEKVSLIKEDIFDRARRELTIVKKSSSLSISASSPTIIDLTLSDDEVQPDIPSSPQPKPYRSRPQVFTSHNPRKRVFISIDDISDDSDDSD